MKSKLSNARADPGPARCMKAAFKAPACGGRPLKMVCLRMKEQQGGPRRSGDGDAAARKGGGGVHPWREKTGQGARSREEERALRAKREEGRLTLWRRRR